MGESIWVDVAICIICSVIGGIFVATFFQVNPYVPSRVTKYVLVTLSLIIFAGATLLICYHLWGGYGVMFGIFGEVALAIVLTSVIQTAKESEKNES